MNAVKMHFQRGLRVGAPGWGLEEGEKTLGADVIYSALFHASMELYGEALPRDLRISSGFPFVEDALFFPRPMLPLKVLEDATVRLKWGKAVKELDFLERRWFIEWLRDGNVDLDRAISCREDLRKAVRTITRPRVALDRLDNSSSLYFSSEQRFCPGSGLCCLISCPGGTWQKLKALFRFMGETGIGGEKSSGVGSFEVEFCTVDVPEPGDDGLCVNLAPVIPAIDDIVYLLAYELKERGGWVSSPQAPAARKKKVSVIAEGSVFARPVTGRIVNVAPDGWPHEVLRYGLGLYARVG